MTSHLPSSGTDSSQPLPGAEYVDPAIARAQQLLDLAYAERVHDTASSLRLANEALEMSIALGNENLRGQSLNKLALIHMIRGEYDNSRKLSEEAIDIFRELGDDRGIADAKYNIAGLSYKTDNFHLGLINLVDCRIIYAKHCDYHNLSRVEKSLGTIYEYFGDTRNATLSYERAIDFAEQAGDLNLASNAYNNISGLLLKQRQPEKAEEMIHRSVEVKSKSGDVRGYAFAVYGRGKVHLYHKRYRDAEKDFLEALEIHERMHERLGAGMCFYKLGVLYREMNELGRARTILTKGLEFSEEHNIAMIRYRCNYLLYEVYRTENLPLEALVYLENYLRQKEAVINTQTLKVIENYELIKRMESMEMESKLQKEKAEIIARTNKAEHAARVRQDFLSTMSHEIRTPLNAVITISSLMESPHGKDDPKLRESLKYSANHLMSIINDILDFTKLDSGKMELHSKSVKLDHFLENLFLTYRNMAEEKGIAFQVETDPLCAAFFKLDETKLTQVLGNLITNAIKFTWKGSVVLKTSVVERTGETAVVRFAVTDTGEGIAKSDLEEIFESFYQPKTITTRKSGGTGLGLAIVKRLVNLFGGEIQVSSEVGVGSTFFFDISLNSTQPALHSGADAHEQLRGMQILLVEDNPINSMVASKLLENWGIEVFLCGDGKEAVAESHRQEFNAILMDIHMPVMNGFDAARQIRNSSLRNRNTPILALTADITAEADSDSAHYFQTFLSKPLDQELLFEELLNARRMNH